MSDNKENTNKNSDPVDISSEKKPVLDKLGRAYATGRRKTSVSRVWVKYGNGKIVINGKEIDRYFLRKIYSTILQDPLNRTDSLDKVDVFSTVSGGGLSGQAGALRHGISRALVNLDPSLRKKLKQLGFLTRDARKVERKKFGKHKARRSPQFSKR